MCEKCVSEMDSIIEVFLFCFLTIPELFFNHQTLQTCGTGAVAPVLWLISMKLRPPKSKVGAKTCRKFVFVINFGFSASFIPSIPAVSFPDAE